VRLASADGYDFTEAFLVMSGFGGEQIDSNQRLM
jgi:hypothetical protein